MATQIEKLLPPFHNLIKEIIKLPTMFSAPDPIITNT
ncbi:uncharacterized protein G2W53_035377 [Senna tora]|uniref:Uncharacterized protein n=1 Tax=Senna tora TaxID=362788 RepID=A0A834T3F7_9FABA|nr:uncharacterized protein G2W53_035377 [Senna tora]